MKLLDIHVKESAEEVFEGKDATLFSNAKHMDDPFLSYEEFNEVVSYEFPVTEFKEVKFMFACFILLHFGEDF